MSTKLVVIGAISTFLLGCQGRRPEVPIIWQSELTSPDSKWAAVAHTVQNGGFGSASIDTVVALKSMNGTVNSGKPYDVLAFNCYGPAERAYTLRNENEGGTIHLHMRWVDPTHLAVTYDGKADVNLQVARLAGVNISLDVVPDVSPAFELPK